MPIAVVVFLYLLREKRKGIGQLGSLVAIVVPISLGVKPKRTRPPMLEWPSPLIGSLVSLELWPLVATVLWPLVAIASLELVTRMALELGSPASLVGDSERVYRLNRIGT